MTKSTSKQAAKKKTESDPCELTRELTEEAVKRLKELMNSDNDATAVTACKAVLDRGWGRPVELIDQTTRLGAPDPESAAPDTRALMARLQQRNDGRPSGEDAPGAQEPASAKKQGPSKPNGTGEPCKAAVKPKKGKAPSTDTTDSSQP